MEVFKNQIEASKDAIDNLEKEFSLELFKQKFGGDGEIPPEIPKDFLIDERINAKLFHFKVKR